MADAMALAGDIVSCSGLMLLFLLLTEPRYPMRRTAALLSAVFAATAAAYIAAVLGLGLMPGQASLVCFSIPSLTACLLLSKYRDGRFLFTFCTIDVLGFMLIAVSRISAVLLGGDGWLDFYELTGGEEAERVDTLAGDFNRYAAAHPQEASAVYRLAAEKLKPAGKTLIFQNKPAESR